MAEAPVPRRRITGGILAGGRGRRLGGQDKGLIELAGRPLIAHVAARLAPQVGALLVNANRNRHAYRALGHPVVCDADPGFRGPLAGMAALLARAATPWLVVVPCDGPFLPADLVRRLWTARARAGTEIAVAHDGTRLQGTYALLSRRLLPDLRAYLAAGGRRVEDWYARHPVARADFSDARAALFNLNTAADRTQAEARLHGAHRRRDEPLY